MLGKADAAVQRNLTMIIRDFARTALRPGTAGTLMATRRIAQKPDCNVDGRSRAGARPLASGEDSLASGEDPIADIALAEAIWHAGGSYIVSKLVMSGGECRMG
jgi:hypothetical protein